MIVLVVADAFLDFCFFNVIWMRNSWMKIATEILGPLRLSSSFTRIHVLFKISTEAQAVLRAARAQYEADCPQFQPRRCCITCAVFVRWVPPQNSTLLAMLSSASGAASSSSTDLPIATTRTGSGYTYRTQHRTHTTGG